MHYSRMCNIAWHICTWFRILFFFLNIEIEVVLYTETAHLCREKRTSRTHKHIHTIQITWMYTRTNICVQWVSFPHCGFSKSAAVWKMKQNGYNILLKCGSQCTFFMRDKNVFLCISRTVWKLLRIHNSSRSVWTVSTFAFALIRCLTLSDVFHSVFLLHSQSHSLHLCSFVSVFANWVGSVFCRSFACSFIQN